MSGTLAGALAAAAAHARDTGSGEAVLFWVLGPLMVLGSLSLLFAKKAVHAAIGMAGVMIGLGVVYLVEQAWFVGVVQVFVYTGAVMMIFLFVIMLVGVQSVDSVVETIRGQRWAAVVLGLGAVTLFTGVIGSASYPRATGLAHLNRTTGNVTGLAHSIFTTYVWAFELTGALLITAALGAMVLAHRERLTPRIGQPELARRRIRDGAVKAPMPAPGVFARHNSVDTPALLPDGTPSELSVSRVLRARGQVLALADEARLPLTMTAVPGEAVPDGEAALNGGAVLNGGAAPDGEALPVSEPGTSVEDEGSDAR